MATPKTPSKPRTRKAPAAEAPVEAVETALAAAEPAKKPARKKAAAKAPVEVDATPVAAAAPVASSDDARAEIRRRAYALYRAGSRDTFANWIQAERETLGR